MVLFVSPERILINKPRPLFHLISIRYTVDGLNCVWKVLQLCYDQIKMKLTNRVRLEWKTISRRLHGRTIPKGRRSIKMAIVLSWKIFSRIHRCMDWNTLVSNASQYSSGKFDHEKSQYWLHDSTFDWNSFQGIFRVVICVGASAINLFHIKCI